MNFDATVWAAVLGAVGAFGTSLVSVLVARKSKRAEAEERQRVARMVLGTDAASTTTSAASYALQKITDDFLAYTTGARLEKVASDPGLPPKFRPVLQANLDATQRLRERLKQLEADLDKTKAAEAVAAESPEEAKFTRLLVDYYAFALVQARRHSVASLASSILGGIALIAGLVYGVTQAGEPGAIEIAGIVSAAGVLTNGIAVLFHRQANKAMAIVEGQTKHLREDMGNDRDAEHAVNLLSEVEDKELRDQLRAALVLQLSRAQLPDLSGVKREPGDPKQT